MSETKKTTKKTIVKAKPKTKAEVNEVAVTGIDEVAENNNVIIGGREYLIPALDDMTFAQRRAIRPVVMEAIQEVGSDRRLRVQAQMAFEIGEAALFASTDTPPNFDELSGVQADAAIDTLTALGSKLIVDYMRVGKEDGDRPNVEGATVAS